MILPPKEHYLVIAAVSEHGFINCGKGQPGQSGWMTHAAAHARFRQVNVINPKG